MDKCRICYLLEIPVILQAKIFFSEFLQNRKRRFHRRGGGGNDRRCLHRNLFACLRCPIYDDTRMGVPRMSFSKSRR